MKRHPWYRPLSVAAMLIPFASSAQGPQPRVRQVATLPGIAVNGAGQLPKSRVIIYTAGDSINAYDPVSKRSTLIARGLDGEYSISPLGDRVAYSRADETGTDHIWSIPINPTTGAPTGTAQRVSLSHGDTPSISPDGKMIAFDKYAPTPTGGSFGTDLTLVPAAGGAERVLGKFPRGVWLTAWSVDGKSVYIQHGTGPTASFVRVPAAGGPSEEVTKVGAQSPRNSFGMTGLGIDSQIFFYQPDSRAGAEGRLAYATTGGVRGEFRIPPGASYSLELATLGGWPLLFRTSRPEWAQTIRWTDGSARTLRPTSPRSRAPVWSPDGRKIALHDSIGDTYGITVMNADGSEARHYAVDAFPSITRWSPDGRALAYSLRPAIGAPPEIGVLDLASGRTRIVSSSPHATSLDFRWKPDGKALVILKTFPGTGSGPATRQVFEATLSGNERMLRDLTVDFPQLTRGGLISSRQLVLGSGPNTEHFLLPTDQGPLVKLPRMLLGGFAGEPGTSHDEQWIAWLARTSDRRSTIVYVAKATGDSLRTIQLPFIADRSSLKPPFSPDGRNLILLGAMPGENMSKIFLVPLDGSTPRTLATLPSDIRITGRLDLSPDGTAVAFTALGAPTSILYELDLAPIRQSINR